MRHLFSLRIRIQTSLEIRTHGSATLLLQSRSVQIATQYICSFRKICGGKHKFMRICYLAESRGAEIKLPPRAGERITN